MSDTALHHFASLRTFWPLVGTYAAIAGAAAWSGNFGAGDWLAAALLGGGLLALSVIDTRQQRLPDRITLPLAAAGVVLSVLRYPSALVEHAAGVAAGYLSLWLVAWGFRRWRGRAGLGLGDAKLFAAGGGWVGVTLLPMVLLIASSLALAWVAIRHLAGGGIDRETRIAFGPFLGLAIWLVWTASMTGQMT